jgi:1-acyl-sn-glycerol-3-phosphate acyltransferase
MSEAARYSFLTLAVTYIRAILLVVVAFYYIITGLLLVPFRVSRRYFTAISGIFGRHMLWACGGKAEIEGLENLDPTKTYIFIGNHQSYADIFLLQAALSKLNMKTLFIIKKELYRIPLFKQMSKQFGLIAVEREDSRQSMKAITASLKSLKSGRSLTVFPEGSRSFDGALQPFKRGGFLLVELTGLEIAPFVVSGTFHIFPRSPFIIRGGACKISFLKPIPSGKYKSKELAQLVEDMISEKYTTQRAYTDSLWENR